MWCECVCLCVCLKQPFDGADFKIACQKYVLWKAIYSIEFDWISVCILEFRYNDLIYTVYVYTACSEHFVRILFLFAYFRFA